MPKKRKTKQEKVIADLRRKLVSQEPATAESTPSFAPTYTFAQTKSIAQTSSYSVNSKTSNLKPTAYSYILSDLRKTVLLTTIAIAAQILLYFVLAR